MGNTYSPYSYLLQGRVEFSMSVLTKWSKSDVLKLYQRYVRLFSSEGFKISKSSFNHLCKNSPIRGLEDLIFKIFAKSSKINIYELMAGVVVYSSEDWQMKLKLFFYVFDFDGNKNISKDELAIAIDCLLKALAKMGGSMKSIKPETEEITDEVYSTLSKQHNLKLEFQELLKYAQSTPNLLKLLKKNQTSTPKEITVRARANSTFAADYKDSTPKSRRSSVKPIKLRYRKQPTVQIPRSSFGKKRAENFRVILGNRHVTKTEITYFKEVFDSVADHQGKVRNEVLCKALAKHPQLQTHVQAIFGHFTNKESHEIDFKQASSYVFKEATPEQLRRILRLAGPEVIPPSPKDKSKLKRQMSFRTASFYSQLFKQYDVNDDGQVDLKELRKGLQEHFDVETIERLFKENVSDDREGLTLEKFINIFAPSNVEVDSEVIQELR